MIIITIIKRRKIHYLLYRKGIVLHLNKLDSPSTKDALCQIWLKTNMGKVYNDDDDGQRINFDQKKQYLLTY